MSLHDKTVLVTGATGFIGTHLVEELIAQKLKVVVLARDLTKLTFDTSHVTVIPGDITADFELPHVDVVFHLAAFATVPRCIKDPKTALHVNTFGTVNLLEKLKDMSPRFVYASTLGVYGRTSHELVKEEDRTSPVEPYAASKLAAEHFVVAYKRAYHMNTVVARIFNCYGEGLGTHLVVHQIIDQLLHKDTVELGNTEPIRDFIYVKDVVDALIFLAEHGDEDVYNVGTGKGTSIQELAETLATIAGKEAAITSVEHRKQSKTVEINTSIADISKIKTLGWKPKHLLVEGLKRTYQHYHDITR